MKTVDKFEVVAAVTMHVERMKGEGRLPSSKWGAYSVAGVVVNLNSLATRLHRLETERANGFRNPELRVRNERAMRNTEKSILANAANLKIDAVIEEMGYVTLNGGAFHIGVLPFQ